MWQLHWLTKFGENLLRIGQNQFRFFFKWRTSWVQHKHVWFIIQTFLNLITFLDIKNVENILDLLRTLCPFKVFLWFGIYLPINFVDGKTAKLNGRKVIVLHKRKINSVNEHLRFYSNQISHVHRWVVLLVRLESVLHDVWHR